MFSVLLKNLCASIYHLLSVDVCVLAHFFDTLVNMSANACRLTKTMDSAISPKSCQELGSLQDLAGHLLLMRLLACSWFHAALQCLRRSLDLFWWIGWGCPIKVQHAWQWSWPAVASTYLQKKWLKWFSTVRHIFAHIWDELVWRYLKHSKAPESYMISIYSISSYDSISKADRGICPSYQLSSGHLMLTFISLRRKNIALEVHPPRDWKLLHASAVGACNRLFLMLVESDHLHRTSMGPILLGWQPTAFIAHQSTPILNPGTTVYRQPAAFIGHQWGPILLGWQPTAFIAHQSTPILNPGTTVYRQPAAFIGHQWGPMLNLQPL